MKTVIITLFAVLFFSFSGKCQLNDTLPAKIVWIKDLKECLLIGVVSFCNPADTSVVISPASRSNTYARWKKMEVGQTYVFAVEKDVAIASPTKKMSVIFKNTIVWTNAEPYMLKPRVCLNCIGKYVN